ncbi:MAG: T9SS type A sorting domain-containing protein, partial [Bacteroidota bacterium]
IANATVSSDGGQSWTHISTASTTLPPGTSMPTYDATEFQGYYSWATGSGFDVIGDTIVVSTNKGYWMSQDKGYNWVRHFSPVQSLNYLPVTIAVKDAQTVMIVTDYDTTFSYGQPTTSFTTRDGGQNWTQGSPDLAVAGLSYIPGTSGTFVLGSLVATGGGVGTAITYDLGNTWYTIDNTTSIGTMDFLNDSVGYAASANGPFGANNLGQIFKWDFDCLVLRDTAQLAVCKSYTLPSNGLTYEAPGMYDVVLTSSFGCDSILTLDLSSTGPSTLVNQNGSTLIAEDIPANTTHQWLRCDQNYSPIAGATVTIYTAMESGQYAVEVSSAGCVDTSDCYLVCFPSTESIVKSEDTLSVEAGAASYQWLDCNNDNAPINGATTESFVPSSSGTFAVAISSAIGCIDTLPCVNLFLTDINQLRVEDFRLSPNPASDFLRLSVPRSVKNESLEINILDMSGRVLIHERNVYSEGEAGLDIRALASGIYLLQVKDDDESITLRFVKK